VCACIGVALFTMLMIEASGVSNFSKSSQQPQTPQSIADVVLSTRAVILFTERGFHPPMFRRSQPPLMIGRLDIQA
jgi:hypothetical protein